MPLTASGLEQLASAKLLLANTQGFMYLPVLVPHEVAAEAVLSELKAANEVGGYAWLAIDWPTLSSAFDKPPSRTEIAQARQHLLSAIDAIIQADTSAPRSIVLDASPSTRHVLAQDVIVYLNQRRQLLRERALRLIVAWPLALRDDLIVGAPDLWSVRALSPSLSLPDVFLPDLEGRVIPVQSPLLQPQEIIFDTAAQEHKYALWQATRSLDAADLSHSEMLDLLYVLYRHHHGREMLELIDAARARTTDGSLAAALAGCAGMAFGELGKFSDALIATQEAVTRYRRLAQANPGAYESYFATSMNNLVSALSATGDRAAALDAAREAVAIRGRLAQASPAAYEADWAGSINNLANSLSATGDPAGALDAAREAVVIYRRLAQANPAAYEPDLAGSIHNLANSLGETGDRAGALEAAREAVTFLRRLARANPAAYEPGLAASINTVAISLRATGDHVGALYAAREAVAIYRRLAQANPAGYEPNLARSLYVLAFALLTDDQAKLAVEAANEAVALLRPWAEQFPEAYGGLLRDAEALVAKLDTP